MAPTVIYREVDGKMQRTNQLDLIERQEQQLINHQSFYLPVPARWFAGNSSTPEERHTANESEMVSDYQEYVDDTMPLPADVEREFMEKGHDQVSAIAWLAELEI